MTQDKSWAQRWARSVRLSGIAAPSGITLSGNRHSSGSDRLIGHRSTIKPRLLAARRSGTRNLPSIQLVKATEPPLSARSPFGSAGARPPFRPDWTACWPKRKGAESPADRRANIRHRVQFVFIVDYYCDRKNPANEVLRRRDFQSNQFNDHQSIFDSRKSLGDPGKSARVTEALLLSRTVAAAMLHAFPGVRLNLSVTSAAQPFRR